MKLLLFTKRNKEYFKFINLAKSLFSEVLIVYPDLHPRRKEDQFCNFIASVREFNPDILLSFYYNRVIQSEIIDSSRLYSLNFHGSLLPNYAGSHALNWQIINGETVSGVTVHNLTKKIDDGEIFLQESFSIDEEDTAYDVLLKGISTSCNILNSLNEKIRSGNLKSTPQNFSGDEFKCRKRSPVDGEILASMSSDQVYNLVRALSKPWPGAFYIDENCKKIVVDSKISIEDARNILKKLEK